MGGENNRALAMWSIPNTPGDDMTNSPEHVQTLAFAPEGDVFNFAACAAPGARLVLVSNLKKQAVYAVHFAEGARGFDYVAEFSTAMPVLSFTALREDADDAAGGAGPAARCSSTACRRRPSSSTRSPWTAAARGVRRRRGAQAQPESESEAESESERRRRRRGGAAGGGGAGDATGGGAEGGQAGLRLQAADAHRAHEQAAGEQDVGPPRRSRGGARAQGGARALASRREGGPRPLPPGPAPGAPPPFAPSPATAPPPPSGAHGGASGRFARADHNDISGFVAAQRDEREAAEREPEAAAHGRFGSVTRDLPVQIEKILKKELKGVVGEMGKAVTAARRRAARRATPTPRHPAALPSSPPR